jgi:hypothetical protein
LPGVRGVEETGSPTVAVNVTVELKGVGCVKEVPPAVKEPAPPARSAIKTTLDVVRVEPGGFDTTVGDDRVKFVAVPLVEMATAELFPLRAELEVLVGDIEIEAPFTLQVAGTVPVAVIVPLVAA